MSRPKIGQILMQQGVCDRAALLLGWEQKVLFGDRIGTNLLAAGVIDEKSLALALGKQHGVHAAFGTLITVTAQALALVPGHLAQRHMLIPHHVDASTLFVLMRTPDDIVAIQDVEAISRLTVVPVVACEARIWDLLSSCYGLSPGLRPVPLALSAPPKPSPTQTLLDQAPVSDLMGEDAFNSLYMQKDDSEDMVIETLAGGAVFDATVAEVPQLVDDAAPPSAPLAPAPPPVVSAPIDRQALAQAALDAAAAEVITPQPAPTAADDADDDHDDDDVLDLPLSAVVEEVPAERAFAAPQHPQIEDDDNSLEDPLPAADPQSDGLPIQEDSPLSFDDATSALELAQSRSEIAHIVLRYARSGFARAALLTVHPGNVLGWRGLGEGTTTENLSTLRLTRDDKSVFTLVADSSSHYIGPLQKWVGNGAWVKHAGRQIPTSVAVFPVLVRGRVVNLLYCDNGHQNPVLPEDGSHSERVGELLILAQKIAASYEALLASSSAALR